MATRIRTEISRRKDCWVPKHRQLELVHFCLQYPEWKAHVKAFDGYSDRATSLTKIPEENGSVFSPVEEKAERLLYFTARMAMVEEAATEAAADLAGYLLRGVTEGVGYELLGIPCCKETYYRMYRRFFWILDKQRK